MPYSHLLKINFSVVNNLTPSDKKSILSSDSCVIHKINFFGCEELGKLVLFSEFKESKEFSEFNESLISLNSLNSLISPNNLTKKTTPLSY